MSLYIYKNVHILLTFILSHLDIKYQLWLETA